MRAVAKKTAASIGGNYDDFNFVVAHLGGGFTISAHRKGKMIDNLSDDEGAFSPERCGVLGGHSSVMICESMGVDTYRKLLRGKGGLVSHFGDSDLRHLEQLRVEGDEYAALIFDAMAYQIAKFVGALATVLGGQVDQIIFTGGLAYSTRLLDKISDRVKFIAPITVYPGENEMEALAMGGLRVLKGEETARMWNESSL
jgi:butyrate kinase